MSSTAPHPDRPDRPDRPDHGPALRHLRGDPLMRELIDAVGPCTLAPDPAATLFDRLASSIVSQQLSVGAARTIAGRLREHAGVPAPAPGPSDTPDPSTAFEPGRLHLDPVAVRDSDDARLRACGLSRPKVAAMRDLADAVLTGRVPTLEQLAGMDDDEVVESLTAVRGIGEWTVQMLLIFQLGRPDVFPVADVGVRRGFERRMGLDRKATAAEMTEYAQRWAPYRSVATWYLWRALEL